MEIFIHHIGYMVAKYKKCIVNATKKKHKEKNTMATQCQCYSVTKVYTTAGVT